MEVKIIKEVIVDSKYFEFKVGETGNKYQLVIPESNADKNTKSNHALVFWIREDGSFNSVWYTLNKVKQNIENGFWIVTKVLHENLQQMQ